MLKLCEFIAFKNCGGMCFTKLLTISIVDQWIVKEKLYTQANARVMENSIELFTDKFQVDCLHLAIAFVIQ